MRGRLHVGTSGFDYPEWKGSFYPADLRRRDMLPYYAQRFGSVEINYTFRREATREVLRSWVEATPPGFVFTLKAHQRLTHWQRLGAPDDALERFLEQPAALRDRLGAVLFQLPPTLAADRALLEAFLARLPSTVRTAFEFRHPSWAGLAPLLAEHGSTWCVAETDDAAIDQQELPPGPFAYLRLRRTRYTARDLRAWAGRVERVLADGRDVYCYFKHEEAGAGPKFAQRLLALLA